MRMIQICGENTPGVRKGGRESEHGGIDSISRELSCVMCMCVSMYGYFCVCIQSVCACLCVCVCVCVCVFRVPD